MRIVAITHYPGALRCFIDTAAHLDHAVPGWGSLTLFDSAQPLGDLSWIRLDTRPLLLCGLVVPLLRISLSWS